MDWHGVKQDWRIWLLVVSLLASFSLIINPLDPYTQEDGEIRLKINIEQGLDLQGGARVLVKPSTNVSEETVNQIISTLRTRISAFGLQEMDIRPVQVGDQRRIQIELAGANTSDLTELINRTGSFEARIPVTLTDGETLTVGSRSYTVGVDEGTVTVANRTVTEGGNVTLSSGPRDVRFTYTNRTGGRVRLSALAFTGADVLGVDINPQRSGVTGSGNQWQFRFQVSVTDTAAERVRDIVQQFPRGVQNDNLQGAQLVLSLDNERVSSLGIANSFRAQPVQNPLITGGAQSQEAARDEMEQLQSVLQSGALPVPITIISTTTVSATLGQQFLQTAILAIVVAILAVAVLVFIRYRDPRIAAPLALTGFSELVMILGFAAAVNSTIDLPSIAGIIAAVGTGVDDQIIITDERGKERTRSFKERFKRAFFIIFTSAASTIAAMLPLTQIGAGTVQGFAITTIVGVIIGVSITRPAYARMLQYMDE